MILGVGIDIVNIERFEQLWAKYNTRFIHRFFPKAERLTSMPSSARLVAQHYAKRFAAKEAFVKAVGTGFGEHIGPYDMWVENTPEGKPLLILTPTLHRYISDRFGGIKIKIDLSMADEYPMAQAFVILSEDSHL